MSIKIEIEEGFKDDPAASTETEEERLKSQREQEKLNREIKVSRWVAISLLFLLLTAYFLHFSLIPNILRDHPIFPLGAADTWGQFGDFVGGLLNPVIAAFALYWLTKSVKIQHIELAESRKALTDAARAQEKQVEESKKMARINALNTLITTLSADISSIRENISIVSEPLNKGSSYLRNPLGNSISRPEAEKLLKDLQTSLQNRLDQRQKYIDHLLVLDRKSVV